MSDPHPVQSPIGRALGCVEVRVEVNVNQTYVLAATKCAGYSSKFDRAVSADYEYGGTAAPQCGSDPVGNRLRFGQRPRRSSLAGSRGPHASGMKQRPRDQVRCVLAAQVGEPSQRLSVRRGLSPVQAHMRLRCWERRLRQESGASLRLLKFWPASHSGAYARLNAGISCGA